VQADAKDGAAKSVRNIGNSVSFEDMLKLLAACSVVSLYANTEQPSDQLVAYYGIPFWQ